MGFAAAKIGLELNHRIAALSGKPPDGINQHSFEALRQICAAEEFGRVAILIRTFIHVHLPEIRRKLSLRITAARHILVWRDYFPPWFQACCRNTFDCCAGAFSFFSPHLFVINRAPQLHLDFSDLVGLWSGNSRQQAFGGIKRPVGVITGKWILMRPFIAHFPQFADNASFSSTQCFAKDEIPLVPNNRKN